MSFFRISIHTFTYLTLQGAYAAVRVPVFQKGIPLFPEGVAVFKHRHALALFREGVRAAAAENASLLSQEGAAAPEFFFQKVAQMRNTAPLTQWRLRHPLGNPKVLRAILRTRPGL